MRSIILGLTSVLAFVGAAAAQTPATPAAPIDPGVTGTVAPSPGNTGSNPNVTVARRHGGLDHPDRLCGGWERGPAVPSCPSGSSNTVVAAASSLATIPTRLIACVLSGTARQCLTPQTGVLLSEEGELPLLGLVRPRTSRRPRPKLNPRPAHSPLRPVPARWQPSARVPPPHGCRAAASFSFQRGKKDQDR